MSRGIEIFGDYRVGGTDVLAEDIKVEIERRPSLAKRSIKFDPICASRTTID
jgi:hypothetical protein